MQLGLHRTMAGGSALAIIPIYRIWSIGDSKETNDSQEPRNKTREWGLRLSYTF